MNVNFCLQQVLLSKLCSYFMSDVVQAEVLHTWDVAGVAGLGRAMIMHHDTTQL